MRAEDERRYVEYVGARLPWIRKIAFLLCHDWHRADDIAQTAITRLYVHWRHARAAVSLDAYTRTVVVRVFLTERRGGWATRVDLPGELPIGATVDEADPALRLAVRWALADVPPRQRAALVLRYYCDLSVEETAEVLRCSAGTVKSQTARGLDALRRVMDARQITVEG